MKKHYTAPYIERNSSGNLNKYAHTTVVRHQDNIDGVPIKTLVQKYGTPLFVFSEKQIRRTYRRLLETIRIHYPKVDIVWSYKTNYLAAICNIFHQEGASAEVVSRMEYEKARSNGIPGNRIYFNGPSKRKQDLQIAIKEGAYIHIDHLEELYQIENIAEELAIKPKVAIRVNMDTGISPMWTRFGFNYENGEAYRTVQRLISGNIVQLVGLHTHIGTFILDPNAYYWAATKLLNFAQTIKDNFGIVLDYIDMGGGFASNNTLIDQYTPGELASPSFEQYAEAIGTAFNASHYVKEYHPRLILETGRVLIDESGYLIASVLGKKNLPTGERAVILDAGVNINITAWWYKQRVLPTKPFPGTYQNTVFYGPLCMNIDVIRSAMPFPDLYYGDTVIISPVGAYNVTQWMQFIEYRPNVCLINETGEVDVIRSQEDLSDLTSREYIPDHLRQI
ncbi:MAG: alanine racemase [Candidatus Cloacimonas acidaminovorans]|jgi:diaminopimelate decarboxylase|nr:alanine racemase [Candidatus Cloacimonas acidaminovorans]MDD5407161.1 alanine racemase [Candidatus Cloacimonas acidaminovorans]